MGVHTNGIPTKDGENERSLEVIMAIGKVEICGVNTSNLPLLTNEQKEALFQRIQTGDEDARNQYIEGNLRGTAGAVRRTGHIEHGLRVEKISCVAFQFRFRSDVVRERISQHILEHGEDGFSKRWRDV